MAGCLGALHAAQTNHLQLRAANLARARFKRLIAERAALAAAASAAGEEVPGFSTHAYAYQPKT